MTQNNGGQVYRQGWGWVEREVIFTEDDFADDEPEVEDEGHVERETAAA